MTELSVVGKSVTRLDAFDKVTGAAKYTSDFMVGVPGVLEGRLLTSPYPHARILSIDTSEAQKLPDVKFVLTAKDAPANLQGTNIKDQPLLARDVVRFIGEPVAVVAAETVEAAEKAISLIKVDYEELPAIFDPEDAMRDDAPVIIHPDFEQYERVGIGKGSTLGSVSGLGIPNVCAHYKVRKGDVERGFQEADLIVENRFTTSRLSHAQMEPDHCIAQKGSDGTLTVWSSQKVIFRTKSMLCGLFNLPPSKVRVINLHVGGSFGRRPIIEQFCALLALKTYRPVRMTLSREQVFAITHTGPANITYIKDGVKKDGTLVARELKLIINVGAYSIYAPHGALSFPNGAVGTYRIPNFKLDSYGVYTNELTMMTLRGVGAPQLHAATETQMDIIAHKLGIDPVELIKRNILNEGEKNVIGETTHSIGVRECLEKAAEFIEWGKPSEQGTGPWRKGKGVAVCNKFGMGGTVDCVHIQIHEDGTIELRHGSDEIGQGANTVLAQIAAEEFGIPMDRMRVVCGDTANVPFSASGASASKTTFYSGNATRLACQDAKQQIFALAAPLLKALPHELETTDGKVFVKNMPERFVRIPALFWPGPLYKGGEIVGKGVYSHKMTPMDPETGQIEKMMAFYLYGANAVEVAVNIRTGEVRVLKVGSAWDMGQLVNPKLCEGQIEGGLSWGIGMALGEGLKVDKGRVLNPNFRDYKIPRAAQMPDRENMKSFFVMALHNEGPYGAKGVGEGTNTAAAPAINNAIFNAIGVRLYELPLTPEKILRHLKEKKDESPPNNIIS
ncbi:xanthine dehydrogenase family protein molybdopterin-binding subunit [Chloroflexota bacterium]